MIDQRVVTLDMEIFSMGAQIDKDSFREILSSLNFLISVLQGVHKF